MKIYNNDFKEAKVLEKLGHFNEFLNYKVDQIKEYLRKNKSLKRQLEWVTEWDKNERIKKIQLAIMAIGLKQIETKRIENMVKLVDNYIKYFKVIDKENCEEARYEEMFRTIIEVPDELVDALEIRNFKIGFDKDRYYNNKSQINIDLNLRSELPLAG
ncbi:hypothetical protein [Clostridium tyrobutyricum]|uniref:hypothetical protein n=1 Tax=Clostridium tyrobutyricum TaxID=1519 RepID=UPI001C3850DA|nr:hypothetical protein [Clostridium tyrobutyricum]MBV4439315.1 hypothetical protein [Clostridium tyrobutyricum]